MASSPSTSRRTRARLGLGDGVHADGHQGLGHQAHGDGAEDVRGPGLLAGGDLVLDLEVLEAHVLDHAPADVGDAVAAGEGLEVADEGAAAPRGVELVAREHQVVEALGGVARVHVHRIVGHPLGAVGEDLGAGARGPSGRCAWTGLLIPVTLETPVTATSRTRWPSSARMRSRWARSRAPVAGSMSDRADVVVAHRLHPGQEVGVVLHHRGDHQRPGEELVDGLAAPPGRSAVLKASTTSAGAPSGKRLTSERHLRREQGPGEEVDGPGGAVAGEQTRRRCPGV